MGLKSCLIDADRRELFLYPIDKLLKPFLGVRKFATDVCRLTQFFRKTGPSVVQIESMFPWGLIGWLALMLLQCRAKCLVTQHTVDYLTVPFDYFDRLKNKFVSRLCLLACRRIYVRANSHRCYQWLITSGVPEDRVRMVPVNIAGAFKWSYTSPREDDRLKFVSISRYVPMKALDVLIESFRGVVNVHPEAQLDIYGFTRWIEGIGDYRTFLERLVANLQLSGNVVLKGEVDSNLVPDVISQ